MRPLQPSFVLSAMSSACVAPGDTKLTSQANSATGMANMMQPKIRKPVSELNNPCTSANHVEARQNIDMMKTFATSPRKLGGDSHRSTPPVRRAPVRRAWGPFGKQN